MRAALVLLALGACSFPEKELIDAGTPFGCVNEPNPTVAENPAVMRGQIIDAMTKTGLENASISGRLPGSTSSIFTLRSSSDGTFRQSQNTNDTPLDISLAVTANGYIDTYFYPATKLSRDVDYKDIAMVKPMVRDTIASMAQITLDPAKGHILMRVTDCVGNKLAGATASASPAGTTIYFVNSVQPSPQATATDSGGAVLIANLPPTGVTLTGMVNGIQLKTHTVTIVADAFVVTELRP
jgi:hypothetical protein